MDRTAPFAAIVTTVLATGGVALATACEPYASTPRARMARELACSEDRTRVLTQAARPSDGAGMRRMEAMGCGRAATYVCSTTTEECWREGEVRDAPHGPPLGASSE